MSIWKMIDEQISLVLTLTLLAAAAVIMLVLLPMMHHFQELEVKENFLMKDAGLINGLIRAQGNDHSNPKLIAFNNAPIVMGEIADLGNAHSITFLSMVNQDKSESSYKMISTLPIDLETQSTYKQLGLFMGGLDELRQGIILIDSFQIVMDTQEPDKVKAKIHIHICLKKEGNGKK